MSPTKRRFVVFFTGIVIFLLVLEVALRVVGMIYAGRAASDTPELGDGDRTVLCVGDSVTFGIGAPRELSYPAQLQNLLNESYPRQYKVINRGWPAQNTAQILMRLEDWLKEFQPAIVTILIGAQNRANFFGYQQYLKTTGDHQRTFLQNLHDSLDRVRVYKFVRLLFGGNQTTTQKAVTTEQTEQYYQSRRGDSSFNRSQNSEQLGGQTGPPNGGPDDPSGFFRFPTGPDGLQPGEQPQGPTADNPGPMQKMTRECMVGFIYKSQGRYEEALESILSVIDKPDLEPDCLFAVGAIHQEQQQYDKAIEWFKKGIERDPGYYRYYEGIGQSYREQDRPDQALAWYKKGFEQARYETLYDRCYLEIALTFKEMGDSSGAIAFFEKETKRQPLVDDYLHKLAGDYLLMFQNTKTNPAVSRWIEADIGKMIELCNRYNARAILQNYPVEPMVNLLFQKIAKRHKVVFVNQQASFTPHVKGRILDERVFAPDGHPNDVGYGMMAKNLSKAIGEAFH